MNNSQNTWPWKDREPDSMDSRRLDNAKKLKIVEISTQPDTCSATFQGSSGAQYLTSLTMCTCKDFAINNKRKEPCKHIIRLAMEAGVINACGNTPDQQRKSDFLRLHDELALAYGNFYLFDDPMIPDCKYDEMKRRYLELKEEFQYTYR